MTPSGPHGRVGGWSEGFDEQGKPAKTAVAANVDGVVINFEFRGLVVGMDRQGNPAEENTEREADDQGQAFAAALAFGQAVVPRRRTDLDVLVGGYHLDAAAVALAAAKNQVGARLA